ncbi:MAG TPA: diguanylate cyclase [Thermoleophilaceae bacterium]|nr:diguanylate cyclase [Thermoleophilaceae bacterium]
MDRPFDRESANRTLGYFFIAGATLSLAALLMPGSPTADGTGLAAIVALAFATGGALFFGAGRLPAATVPLALVGGVGIITAGVYFDGQGPSPAGLYYIWLGVLAFYFLSRWQAGLMLALTGAAFAGVLHVLPTVQPHQRWLTTMGITAIAGMLISFVRDRVQELVARLTDAARTDPLTGLLNRRALEELFAHELERARRSGRALSVIVGDLDRFKFVNDRLGHQQGDETLCALADELDRWKRRVDMVARVGGEEFALLLPETDERGAFLVAERLRRATKRLFADGPCKLTISFGVATFPDHGSDAESLLRAADKALYAAKNLGRDRSVIFSAEISRMLSESSDGGAGSELRLATVLSVAEALDIRDFGSANHSQAVGRYAHLAAEELGLQPEHAERVRLAGLLHDVGKIGVSEAMLIKPGPLDEEEWAEMRTHPEIAARLLAGPEFEDLRSWILAHHERPDGSGYPYGLSGDEIPLEARILAVADAWEAMTADRVYSSALSEGAAREELVAGSGTQFDGAVVEAFLRALDRLPRPPASGPVPSITN